MENIWHSFRRQLRTVFLLLLLVQANAGFAARFRPTYEEDRTIVLREILDSLNDLRHQINNHENEIRIFEEKFHTQEEIVDALRLQVAESVKIVKDTLKQHHAGIEAKFSNFQEANHDLKNHASDATSLLSDYKKRILDLEKTVELQSRNMENLQAALVSIAEILQIKEAPPISNPILSANGKIYKVKSGDSLEKIAKQNNTTIKKLKELNNLTNDQIIIGQKLQLPE
jgi:LysM repeat protein